ncbi:hypothetical protein ALC53_10062, partial [Atta colombica]
QIATNVLLENDCIADRENVSDRCPLSLVSCEESSSRIVPSTNLDTTDVEYLCHSWISIMNANDEIWNPYASLQLDDTKSVLMNNEEHGITVGIKSTLCFVGIDHVWSVA